MGHVILIVMIGLVCIALFLSIRFQRMDNKRLILLILLEKDESYGFELVEMTKGRLEMGFVHSLLRSMENDGLLETREDHDPGTLAVRGGHPRIMYRLSPSGYNVALQLKKPSRY